ncbi:hypothetical protein R6Q59_003696 [Mikania micrantha]
MDLFPITNVKSCLNLMCFLLIMFVGSAHDDRRSLPHNRPNRSNARAFARWLVAESNWGVLSTVADELGGAPLGDVVLYSDGQPYHGTGIPYFYLTSVDPIVRYALEAHRSSFTISEYPLGTCGSIDPETCSKITLSGRFNEIETGSEEADVAKKALISKHAEIKNWPKDDSFKVYKLDIEEIFLIDFYGGPKPLRVDQYFLP